MHDLDVDLEKLSTYLRGICMALRACYKTSTPWVKLYTQFKQDIHQEAVVFKDGLLPLSVLILCYFRKFLENYIEKDFSLWKSTLVNIRKRALECEQLCECLVGWYTHIAKDMEKWPRLGTELLEALYLDERKFEKESRVMRIRSKVVDELFVPLLFVPNLNTMAAPFVHGGSDKDFIAPPVAETEEEIAVVGVMAMKDTMISAVQRTIERMTSVTKFFEVTGNILEEMTITKPKQDGTLEDRQRRHYEAIGSQAFRIQTRCDNLAAINSLLKADAQYVPVDKEKYVETWLNEKTLESEKQIADHLYDATEDIEILECLEPP